MGIMRLGHVDMNVLNIEESRTYYENIMGLNVTREDEDGTLYFKCWDEWDKYSLILDENLEEYELVFSYVEEYDVVELFKAVGDMYKSLTAVAGDDTLIKDFDPQTLRDRLDPEMTDNKFELSTDMLKRLLKAIKLEGVLLILI